jgi:uncharacterized membrane protein
MNGVTMEHYNNIISGWLGASHVFLATLALFTGAIVLLNKKGTSLHKKYGYTYVISMLLMNITAIPLSTLFGGLGPFHFFVLISLPTVLVAIYFPMFARHKKNWLSNHFEFMAWSYVGLVAAFFAEVVVRIPIILAIESNNGIIASVFALSGVTMWGGSFLIKKHRSKIK